MILFFKFYLALNCKKETRHPRGAVTANLMTSLMPHDLPAGAKLHRDDTEHMF